MPVLRNDYDLEKHVDETWYESTNVIYSKFIEDKKENKGDLYVVFKEGKQYLYKSVSYQNYLSFKRGIVDGSSGKAFNEYIIKVYKGERVEDVDMNEIIERLNSPKEKELTYFVHGDGEVDDNIFNAVYIPAIDYILNIGSDTRIAVKFTDKYGMRCAEYVVKLHEIDPSRITIYIKDSDYDGLSEEFQECKVVKVNDSDYDENFIDLEIIKRSFEDVGYISEESLGEISKISKTAYIILTRRML